MDLRSKKLSRVGAMLVSAWAAVLLAMIFSLVGSLIEANGRVTGEVIWAVVRDSLLLPSLVFALIFLFIYSGFSFSYEGRHLPSLLFTGIRALVFLYPLGTLVFNAKSSLIPSLSVSNISINDLFNGSDTLMKIGLITFAVGFALSCLLFFAYSFTSADYNGSGFMIMSIIFTALEIVGFLLFVVEFIILASRGAGFRPSTAWYSYVSLGFLLIARVTDLIAFIVGYQPADGGSAPQAQSYGTSGYSGYNY